jgi:antitoxin MazE
MDVSLIRIGNSKGIRLPKALLEKYNIQDTIELVLKKGYIVLKPKTKASDGWEAAFKTLHERGDDQMIVSEVFEDEDFEEWN